MQIDMLNNIFVHASSRCTQAIMTIINLVSNLINTKRGATSSSEFHWMLDCRLRMDRIAIVCVVLTFEPSILRLQSEIEWNPHVSFKLSFLLYWDEQHWPDWRKPLLFLCIRIQLETKFRGDGEIDCHFDANILSFCVLDVRLTILSQFCRKFHRFHLVQTHFSPVITFHCNAQSFTATCQYRSTGNSIIGPSLQIPNSWYRKWAHGAASWLLNRFVTITPEHTVVSGKTKPEYQITALSW